jgi:hypothetical protein
MIHSVLCLFILGTLQAAGIYVGPRGNDTLRLQFQTKGSSSELISAPFPGKVSEWKNFPRYDFELAGRVVTIVTPAKTADGTPWLWRGEFFGAFATVDEALLRLGWHIVYMACPNTFGSPDTMVRWSTLYQDLTRNHRFSRRPVLLGMSRGGLYVYNLGCRASRQSGAYLR